MRCVALLLVLAAGDLCLAGGIPPEKRTNFTIKGSYNGKLKMFTLLWESARVATKVMKTILEEVFGYHVDDSMSGWSAQEPVYAMAGCKKDADGKWLDCLNPANHDIRSPGVHLGFEMWRVPPPPVPKANMPELYGVLEYMGEEGVFMQPATAKKFYDAGRIVTIYNGWDAAVFNDFADNFMTLGELLASNCTNPKDCDATKCTSPEGTCWSDKTKMAGSTLKDSAALKRVYNQYYDVSAARKSEGETVVDWEYATGDSAADPCCYDIAAGTLKKLEAGCGGVWVAPRSRADPLGCIPLVTSSDWGYFLPPQAAKFGWPICYISVNWGDYVHLGRTFNILTYWWTPDVTFTKMNFAEIRVPKNDGLARSKGDHTTKLQVKCDNLGWKFVRSANEGRGQFIAKLGLNVGLYDPDPAQWMADKSGGMNNQEAACNWLKGNEARWRKWVPDMEPPCPVGQQQDVASGACVDCLAGTHASVTNRERIMWDCVTCDPGRANPLNGSGVCPQCERGQFSDAPGATACQTCPSGKFQRAKGQSACGSCLAGTFTARSGEHVCEQCKVGFYQSAEQSSGCDKCPATFDTQYPASTALKACTCIKGRFWNRKDDQCDSCQAEGVCTGGLQPPSVFENNYGVYVGGVPTEDEITDKQVGDYKKSATAFEKLLVYTCTVGKCAPTPEKPWQCASNREDIACAVCSPGFYLQNCIPCGEGGMYIFFVIFLMGTPFAMWVGCVVCAKPYAAKATAAFQLASTFGIMAIFVQMLGMMSGFNMPWMDMGFLFRFCQIFLLDLEGIGIGCLVGNGFAAQYYCSFLLPLVMAAIMCFLFPISHVITSIKGHSTKLTVDGSVNFLGMLYSALYISLVKMVVAYFECVPNPAAPATLAKYAQIECNTSRHTAAQPAMIMGMIFYVFGFYAICLWLNIQAPKRFTDPNFRNRCKFLVNRWRVDIWYWGTVYMTRNLFLAMIAVASSTGVDQCIMMALVMSFFLMITAAIMPWKDDRLAQFDNTISFIVIFAVCAGMGFMQIQSEVRIYEREDSDRARDAIAAAKGRISVFSILLGMALGCAGLCFFVLLCYCLWWMKNMKRLTTQDAKMQQLIVERFQLIQGHHNFQKQFDRYISTGTSYDIRFLCAFMDNMQARLGGSAGLGPMSQDLEAAMKTSGGTLPRPGTVRLTVVEASVKMALARVSFLQADQDEDEIASQAYASGGC